MVCDALCLETSRCALGASPAWRPQPSTSALNDTGLEAAPLLTQIVGTICDIGRSSQIPESLPRLPRLRFGHGLGGLHAASTCSCHASVRTSFIGVNSFCMSTMLRPVQWRCWESFVGACTFVSSVLSVARSTASLQPTDHLTLPSEDAAQSPCHGQGGICLLQAIMSQCRNVRGCVACT